MFQALLLEKSETGENSASIKAVDESRLPEGDVLIEVAHSTLNYKDGLAITKGSVVRQWPMVAGIDGAGTVLESTHPDWHPGDLVVHNGWGVGESRWGCLAQKARLKGEWLVRLPEAFTTAQAMAIGTAGYTAMLCVLALERQGLKPGDGEILVTGASGGVGSVATALLGRMGHAVVASTGKATQAGYLEALGAREVIDRRALSEPGKPWQKERWAGVVDAVGSHTLANALAQTRYGGVVTSCGLAQGSDLPTSVLPFILRGVSLIGVDSVMAPLPLRQEAWSRLARDLDPNLLASLATQIPLADAVAAAEELMRGQVRGRIVIEI